MPKRPELQHLTLRVQAAFKSDIDALCAVTGQSQRQVLEIAAWGKIKRALQSDNPLAVLAEGEGVVQSPSSVQTTPEPEVDQQRLADYLLLPDGRSSSRMFDGLTDDEHDKFFAHTTPEERYEIAMKMWNKGYRPPEPDKEWEGSLADLLEEPEEATQ